MLPSPGWRFDGPITPATIVQLSGPWSPAVFPASFHPPSNDSSDRPSTAGHGYAGHGAGDSVSHDATEPMVQCRSAVLFEPELLARAQR